MNMDGVLASSKKKIVFQLVTCLIPMVVTTNVKVKGYFKCTETKVIKCRDVDVPSVDSGVFNCSGYSVGDKCNLTCYDGYYPSMSRETVCKETDYSTGNWSAGNFTCSGIKCREVDVPTVDSGVFNCSGYSVGDKCNLKCFDGYYPSMTRATVCKGTDYSKGNWSAGDFACSDCNNWNKWNELEYKVISNKHTWEVSRQLCENDNSHLVTIANEDVNDFVHFMVSHCVPDEKYISIGLNDHETEGHYQWSDQAHTDYVNWDDGEPNNSNGENCVVIRQNKKWHDYPCGRDYSAICQRNQTL